MQTKLLMLLFAIALVSCAESTEETSTLSTHKAALFSKVPSDQSNITFTNKAIGNNEIGIFNYDYFYNGGGVAVGDLNNDGLQDIIFSGNSVDNTIYLNKGNFVFEDITDKSGIQSQKWTTGITLVDINNDGWLDIYFCNSGPFETGTQTANQLYINNKNNTFKESAGEYGINDPGRSTHASFFDFDRDGDLDLFVLNHSLRSRAQSIEAWYTKTHTISDLMKTRESCTLYRNDGKNKFENISKSAGISELSFGLGHVIRDFNQDGYLDIYIANDFFIPDRLYINNQKGAYKENIKEYFQHIPFYSMGTDAADINNDGEFDFITLDMTPKDHIRNKTMMASMNVQSFKYLTEYKNFIHQYMFNSLSINSGSGKMKDIGLMSGVSQTDWSWAPLLCDFDNNGYKDIFVSNGYKKDILNNDWKNELKEIQKQRGSAFSAIDYNKHLESANENAIPNQLFSNFGNLKFINTTKESGLQEPSFSNGSAYGDLDNDGDLDLIVNNFDKAAFLYKNNSSDNQNSNYLRVQLLDPSHKGKEYHAELCIHYKSQIQCNTYAFTRGFQSHTEQLSHFGLGEVDEIDSLVINWLDGTSQKITSPKVNTTVRFSKNRKKSSNTTKKKSKTLFKEVTLAALSTQFNHIENNYNEYNTEILLPHSQSNEGPALAVGDLNGDKLEDFFVGGSTGQSSKVYLQNSNGTFDEKSNPDLEAELSYEDVGAKFADIDKDGDLDLYVSSGGGSEFLGKELYYQDRLYINEGTGRFSKVKIAKIESSTKAIAIEDLNQDGLDEIIVGGKTEPGKYPSAPQSHILSTTRKGIIDITEQYCKELSSIGMVSDVISSDINTDGLTDLILVGEWMPITILINTPSGLVNKTSEYQLENTKGWWNHINKGDFDNDGDDDFIIGNIGLNNKFHPSESKPLYLNANDFDDSGTIDIVLNKIYKGKRVPTRGKECSTEQMPFLNEKFKTYEKYASSSIEEIYSKEKLNNGIKLSATMFESIYLENQNGTFNIKALPKIAQISPINGSAILDINSDGNLDLIIGGNKFNTEAETPRYDGGSGCVLFGNGKGEFIPQWQTQQTGLELSKDVKDLKLIHIGIEKTPAILVANNNDNLQLYLLN